MGKYIDVSHDRRGVPLDFRNRVDLDTALKDRGMDGFYGKKKKNLEQKELHSHLIKRAYQVGEKQAKKEAVSGKMFNKKDIKKL